MRHGKHHHILGVKKEHRQMLLANLASALIEHGKIETTLAKAKALRPFVEKMITLAKKAAQASAVEQKLHFRRLALERLHRVSSVHQLFDEKVSEFLKRNGGYARIYKLLPRKGDASKMAIIEFVAANDTGYRKSKKRRAKKTQSVTSVELVAQEA
ncbi:MAG: 50S ribosomal protein L17 [Puniceicoccales bacterium]|jgi:large subunit ribosomal protein L17|nr:50S ribosomal protein L17 [Puniceicoccales bacterium]